MADKDKKNPKYNNDSQPAGGSELDELYQKLQGGSRRSKPDPIAAALEATQGLAAEADVEQAAVEVAQEFAGSSGGVVCRLCGHRNREGNRFCAMCGTATAQSGGGSGVSLGGERRPRAIALGPNNPYLDPEPEPEPEPEPMYPQASRSARQEPSGQETHHYHHHYHHHYFQGMQEGIMPRGGGEAMRDPERMRPTAALRGDMSRAEAAVRRITHEWVLACNTKHLDDLLELYVADALVLRSNCPPVRGAAAVREFFFGALDAGLGEVEVEPLRVEVAGDMAYETGRCKALVPSSSGKRREERGKYLWVFARQSNGEWKLAVDCWASDLTLTALESDVPASGGPKTSHTRKNT